MTQETMEGTVSFCNKLKDWYDLEFAIAGGDPTAHPEYIKLSSELLKLGPTAIVSHGCDFSEEDLHEISGIDGLRIQFSLPSLQTGRFKFVTGGADLTRALDSLALASALGIPISISSVVSESRSMESDIEEILRLAEAAGAYQVVFNKFLPSGRGALYERELSVDGEIFAESVSRISKSKCTDLAVFVSEAHGRVRELKLSEPKINICFDGNIKSCSMAVEKIGDLRSEPRSLMDRYYKFWSSSSSDSGCICSQQELSQ